VFAIYNFCKIITQTSTTLHVNNPKSW